VIVTCTGSKGSDLGQHSRGLHYSHKTHFDLTVGKSYIVYAMSLINASLTVLVADDYDKPAWLPLGLFEVEDPRLPGHWEFAKGEAEPVDSSIGAVAWQARWGYHEVVQSDSHYYGLEDRDVEALRVFYEERQRHLSNELSEQSTTQP
jgi:hypothetical protein